MRVRDLALNKSLDVIGEQMTDGLLRVFDEEEGSYPFKDLFQDLKLTGTFTQYYFIHSSNKIVSKIVEDYFKLLVIEGLISEYELFWAEIGRIVYRTNIDKFKQTYPYLFSAFDHITDTVNIDREITKEYASTNTKTYQGTKTIENETTGGDTTKTSVKQTTTTNDTTADEYFGFNGNTARPVNSDTSTSTETMSGEADDNVTTVSTTKNGNETVTDDTEHTDVNEGSDTIKTWTVGHSKNKTTEAVTSLNNLNKMRLFELLAKDFDEILTLKIY